MMCGRNVYMYMVCGTKNLEVVRNVLGRNVHGRPTKSSYYTHRHQLTLVSLPASELLSIDTLEGH